MKKWVLAAIAWGLVSCDGDHQAVVEMEPRQSVPIGIASPESFVESDTIAVTASRKGADLEEISTEDTSTQYLAYAYNAELRLPAAAVGATLRRHEQACFDAGPQVCRVLRSSVREKSADSVNGQLEFSAVRGYMTPFREGLAAEAESADGRLVSMSAQVEDLSREIVDTSARLEAQKTLRERLILLLERDTDNVGDLLQVEEQLAFVQAEIESIESYLRVLEGRVKMDRLAIRYQSIRKPVTPSTGRPLQEAFADFFYVVSESLASVVLFIAAAIPWLIVLVPGLFVLSRFARSLRRPK
ncbi:MAG: DUF4349 domain-containing protein [Pseudomonadota bacterium]